MGFLSGIFGGNNGLGYQAQTAYTPQQLQQAFQQQQGGLQSEQGLLNQLAQQGGLANQSNVFNQLGALASGQGPNPAQSLLNNATGQNISNQASLMASQRGAGANTGLLARQAAQQGAGLQQQAVGQGAALQSQQALNALAGMGNIANQQVGNQLGLTQAYQQGTQGGLNPLLSNQAQQQVNQSNTAQQQANSQGGFLGGLGSLLIGSPQTTSTAANGTVTKSGGPGLLGGLLGLAEGGAVPADASNSAGAMKELSIVDHLLTPMKSGGKVAGKARVSGDSEKNDTVPAMLSPGEIVVPRSHSMDPEKAAAFAKAVAMRNKGKKK